MPRRERRCNPCSPSSGTLCKRKKKRIRKELWQLCLFSSSLPISPDREALLHVEDEAEEVAADEEDDDDEEDPGLLRLLLLGCVGLAAQRRVGGRTALLLLLLLLLVQLQVLLAGPHPLSPPDHREGVPVPVGLDTRERKKVFRTVFPNFFFPFLYPHTHLATTCEAHGR